MGYPPWLLGSYSGKALLQICQNVVNVFRADGQPDGIGANALICQFCRCQLAVGGGGRVDHQTFAVCHVGQKGENFQMVDESVGFLYTAFDPEGKNGAAAPGK